jgi:putative methionine-R-sulfoxide reductase with GAF domain
MRKEEQLLDALREAVAASHDLTASAKHVCEMVRHAGGHRWVGLYSVDRARGLISNVAWSGPAAPAYPGFPVSTGLSGVAVRARRVVNVGNVLEDSRYLTTLNATRSEIIVPITDPSIHRVVGTLDVESGEFSCNERFPGSRWTLKTPIVDSLAGDPPTQRWRLALQEQLRAELLQTIHFNLSRAAYTRSPSV